MTIRETKPRLLAIGWYDEDMDLFGQLQQMGFAISPVTSKHDAIKSILSEPALGGLMINADTDLFDAYLLCRIMRNAVQIPIIMVAANGQRLNPNKAADAGADDWALLPISSREFAARMFAKMRRYSGLHDYSATALPALAAMVH